MNYRIIRGSSWFSLGRNARSARRIDFDPGLRCVYFGLRLGLDLGQPSRAIRGGVWIDNKSLARSAYRYFRRPAGRYRSTGRYSSTGIRLALTVSIEL